ncbi:nuclear transport factor 2 family protein [Iodidimonas sp. SYSU 1G8]|uniref:nuclear transport factor 2 family protein n=1 Tax=Iodidimonas sp. SYSU 1G8 TaxID=3133967 RepID=UPI0031FE8473
MKKPEANAVLERQKTLWRPTHSPAAQAYLDTYMREMSGKPLDARRFVATPSGLSHPDIHSIINDRSLGERFFELHCDMLHPTKSTYIDPIFGDLHGQKKIRAWLVPIMSGQGGGASFDPVFPAEFMDDGEGGTSIDEWQLVQPVDGTWKPIVKGISVREYRDGWITYAVDYFDSTPIRIGLAAAAAKGERVVPLPAWPRVPTTAWTKPPAALPSPNVQAWLTARAGKPKDGLVSRPSGLTNRELHEVAFEISRPADYYAVTSDLMHPTDAVYIDPIFGEVRGQQAIRDWLGDIMAKVGHIEFEPLRAPIFDGDVSYSEWRQVAVLPDGKRVVMTRGASVRRYKDGWIVYAADYFDTAPFLDPEIQAASEAAGSTITLDDIKRHRREPLPPAPAGSTKGAVLDILGPAGRRALSTSPSQPPQDAHDKGVRTALIKAAMETIERTGQAGVSIREVSRAVGVSHNAPYFYFADKKALLMAVASESLWTMIEFMEAEARGAQDAVARHRALGVGYIKYAVANPGLFRLISSGEFIGNEASRELMQARIAAAQLLGAAVSDVVRARGGGEIDPKVAAVTAWSLVQGAAMLLIEGQLIPETIGADDYTQVAERMTDLFSSMLAGRA